MPPPLSIIVKGEEEWEIEEILDSRRIRGGRFHYLVKWKGFDTPTREPEENLTEVHVVGAYHERYPERLHLIALVGTGVLEGGYGKGVLPPSPPISND